MEIRTVKLLDICDCERAVAGKIYPKGSSLIALSATKGDIDYLTEDREVESRYAVLTVKDPGAFNSKYVNEIIAYTIQKFCATYQTGINLQFDALKYYEVQVHDIETQNKLAEAFEVADKLLEKEQEQLAKWEKVKEWNLRKMFV